MKKSGVWASLFLGVSVLSGCKSTPAIHVSTAPAVVPAGWASASSRDGSTSVGIPGGWRAGVDKTTDNISDMVSGAVSGSQPATDDANNPANQMMVDLERRDRENEQKELAAMEKRGILVNVINGSRPIPGEARTHYYIRRTHRDGNVTWDEAKEIEQSPLALRPKPTEVKLPIGKALKFETRDEMRDGGVVFQISYVVIEGKDTYALHFITEESKETISTIAEQVAQTWRVKIGR